MRKTIRLIGYLVWFGAGIPMFFFWIQAMGHWLGALGILLGLVVAPGAVVFPFVYWIIEHRFPVQYFELWGIALVGMTVAALATKKD